MIKESKYIIRRVIIGVLIALILGFINSCEVHAESYSVENTNTIARFYPSGTKSNLLWSTLYYNETPNIILSAWDFNMYMPASSTGNILYNGRYLFSFYVYGVGTFRELTCNQITSNFKNVNKTTGSTVQNEITSKCVDIYRTLYHGYYAYRILYEFTYNSRSGPDGIDELIFTFSSGYNPIVGGATGMNYGFEINNISDYDINTINTWNTDKQQQTIINGNTQINNSINTNAQTIINQNTTNTNSIINNQNTNSQNEINNANQNTDKIIDNNNQNFNDCLNYNYTNSPGNTTGYLNRSGNINTQANWRTSDFIKINKNKDYKIVSNFLNYDYCIYNENKEMLQCFNGIQQNEVTINITNGKYIRYDWRTDSNSSLIFTGEYCENRIDKTTESINDVNDTLNDDSIPTDSEDKINDIISSTETQNANISELVNFIPNTLQVIINGFNNSCTGGYSLGSLFGTELVIPCINPVDYLGSFLWGVIDSILCLCYLIPLCKFLVNKYNDLTSLKNLRWE